MLDAAAVELDATEAPEEMELEGLKMKELEELVPAPEEQLSSDALPLPLSDLSEALDSGARVEAVKMLVPEKLAVSDPVRFLEEPSLAM